MKKIIHICNNYFSSKVHQSLISELSPSYENLVIVPLKNKFRNLNSSKDIHVQFYHDFLSYFQLIKSVFLFLKSYTLYSKNRDSIILAHTLWSDGLQALYCSWFFGIRYNIVVRNSDVNFFIPKLIQYRFLVKLIVSKADNVIFVNHSHERKIKLMYPNIYSLICSSHVIPNGVDDFWVENTYDNLSVRENKVLYVGRFNKDKNIESLICAVNLARINIPELTLELVGGTYEELDMLVQCEIPNFVTVHGSISNKFELLNIYRECTVFAMVSKAETFGLVYLEALSQGCSVICTKDEGIDGIFTWPEVIPCKYNDTKAISEAIIKQVSMFNKNGTNIGHRNSIYNYTWRRVGEMYKALIK
ncbi:glycosyltransferase family 4 protein [Vibrio jasicida]|uniref:Glycosyltransferase family 4 protein n=1 Tax=Vibrio jasicida TaxID=766224 RepID=A0ABW7J816_9VIBR